MLTPSPAPQGRARPATTVRHAALLARLNEGASPNARLAHDETIAFGPSMEVERFVLGNGLRVLVLEDHAAPVVCLQTWLGVGSRYEKPGKTGLSHLFEHLMFGEAEGVPHGAFDKLLEEAGAETNAATFLDWTYYHTNLPKEALELTLRLEAHRLAHLVLRDPQVASEKEVVANERRQRVEDDVDGAVSEMLYREAFHEHGYGWPTIGWMSDIQGFTTEDCIAFYKTYYAPNNAVLVLVGDVDLERALALVQEHYGKLDASVIPVEDVRPEPPQTVERRTTTSKPTPTPKLAIGYKSPALGDFDHAPLVLLNEILFGGRSSRVHRSLVRDLEIASEVRAWVGSFRDPSLYDVFLAAREGHRAEELLVAFDAVIDRVRRESVTAEELARAKARLELSTLQGLESVSGKAEQMGFYETVLGDPAALFEKLRAYRKTTLADVLRAARRVLEPRGRTIIEVVPDGSAPDEEDGDEGDEAAQ